MPRAKRRRDEDQWIGVKEAAEILGLSPATIRKYTNNELLKYKRLPNGHRRIKKSDLMLLLKEESR